MAASHPPLRRMQQIDALLRDRRYPDPNALAAHLEVTRRTVLRDLAYLREQCSAPIDYDRDRRGYYYTNLSYRLPAVQLSEGELLAVLVAEKALHAYRGTPFEATLRTAFDKIVRGLPEQIISHAGNYTTAFSFDAGPLRVVPERLFTLFAQAITARQCVQIRYHTQSRNDTNTRTVAPYRLHNDRGDWYLIAHCHLREEVRDFLLYRIEDATPLEEHFLPREDFDIDAYLQQSFGIMKGPAPTEVILDFDPEQARYIRERTWHATQRLTDTPTGGCRLTMTVTGLDEVRRWALSHGRHIRVIAPPALREAVAAEAEELLKNHRGFSAGDN